MLSYTLSMLVAIVLLLVGIRYLLKMHFPATHKASVRFTKLAHGAFRGVIRRLGWYRTLFLAYLMTGLIISLVIISDFGQDPLENIGVLTVIWVPIFGAQKLRKRIRERKARRYRLPGRRR